MLSGNGKNVYVLFSAILARCRCEVLRKAQKVESPRRIREYSVDRNGWSILSINKCVKLWAVGFVRIMNLVRYKIFNKKTSHQKLFFILNIKMNKSESREKRKHYSLLINFRKYFVSATFTLKYITDYRPAISANFYLFFSLYRTGTLLITVWSKIGQWWVMLYQSIEARLYYFHLCSATHFNFTNSKTFFPLRRLVKHSLWRS